ELRRRFQRAAGLTDEELAIAVPPSKPAAPEAAEAQPADGTIPEIAAVPMPAAPPPAPAAPVREARPEPVEVNSTPAQAEVQEVDLSDEWATLLEETRPAEAAAPPPVPAKPAAASPTRQTKPGDVEECQIGEEPPVAEPSAAASAAPAIPLKEVFDEFRAELGEMGAEDEDLETHYNLGIAFREMGLLEEAISEFQKVAKASDRGRAFRYTMQCCTLLGLAFMEKGQPGIAAIWYERALKTPGNDPESTLALRYDLGIAQESAGEPEAALKSFSQVYAMNIDYRDVAERIAALQKPIRRS